MISAVTVTYNDDYKIKEWKEYYDEYKEQIDKLVIVDNGSDSNYIMELERLFPEAVLIKRKSNGGSTAAYNEGIRYLLSDTAIDSIALIGNDIKINKNALIILEDFLRKTPDAGMAAPILMKKNSKEVVEDFGGKIGKDLYAVIYGENKTITDINENIRVTESVPGGMNLAKRQFYESVGLQDENLFMYSDEVDMGIRAKKAEYKMYVLKDAVAWHQHLNPPGQKERLPYSDYLIARNKIYLARKHFGRKGAARETIYISVRLLKKISWIARKEQRRKALYFFWGMTNGIMNNMKLPDGF